jgi:Domain of unknown function (DUF4404)
VAEPELSELLDELRATIDGSESLSADDRARLDGLVARVDAAADEDTDDEADESLFEQLDDALSRFQADHVALVGTINRIANVLSAGGI